MHLLVDGHNLIGQLSGISLADPDDEAKLVLLLRRYATAKRGRMVHVVFDHGVYGHPQQLDGYGVTCSFAHSPQDADSQLIRRIRTLGRPRDWALVSSDRAVTSAARERGMHVISSQDFAARLIAPASPGPGATQEQREFRLSPTELDEWLRLFGEAGAAPDTAAPTRPDPPPDPPPAARKRRRSR